MLSKVTHIPPPISQPLLRKSTSKFQKFCNSESFASQKKFCKKKNFHNCGSFDCPSLYNIRKGVTKPTTGKKNCPVAARNSTVLSRSGGIFGMAQTALNIDWYVKSFHSHFCLSFYSMLWKCACLSVKRLNNLSHALAYNALLTLVGHLLSVATQQDRGPAGSAFRTMIAMLQPGPGCVRICLHTWADSHFTSRVLIGTVVAAANGSGLGSDSSSSLSPCFSLFLFVSPCCSLSFCVFLSAGHVIVCFASAVVCFSVRLLIAYRCGLRGRHCPPCLSGALSSLLARNRPQQALTPALGLVRKFILYVSSSLFCAFWVCCV